jgi:hypothetical protein
MRLEGRLGRRGPLLVARVRGRSARLRGRVSKLDGRKSKPVGRKSKPAGRKSKSGGRKSKSHFPHESKLFNGLSPNSAGGLGVTPNLHSRDRLTLMFAVEGD